jgi:hypothetical protein
MDYPQEFSPVARGRVEAERIRANRDLEKEPVRDRRDLYPYILRVFLVFGHEACELGRQGVWAANRIRDEAKEFLRKFTIAAYYEKGYDQSGHRFSQMTSNYGGLLPEVEQHFLKSEEWHKFEDELLETAESVGKAESGLPANKGDADADFWRDLGDSFRALDPLGILWFDWDCPTGDKSQGNWRLAGTPDIRPKNQFMDLATLAGSAIAENKDSDPLKAWLDALREHSPNFESGPHDYYLDDKPDGTGAQKILCGLLHRVCEASADYCRRLELLLRSQEMKQRKLNSSNPSGSKQPASDPPTRPMVGSDTAQGIAEGAQFNSSPRVKAKYFKALAKLSKRLDKTWKRVFPPDAEWPRETCEAFFQPFAQFGVALYDAYAQELLYSDPSQEQYLQALNFDLKALVCNQIYPYREHSLRTYQDAADADARGELPGEWEVRMGEAWRRFAHPRHSAANVRVRRNFICEGSGNRVVDRVHAEISKRTIHWLSVLAERAATLEASKGAESNPMEGGFPKPKQTHEPEPSPGESSRFAQPPPQEAPSESGAGGGETDQVNLEGAIPMGRPTRSEIKKAAEDAFAVASEDILAEYEAMKKEVLDRVRLTHNSGGYLPALTKWGEERLRKMVLAYADAYVEAFTLHDAPSDELAEKDLETAAQQIAAGTSSAIRGELDLLKTRTGIPVNDSVGHLNRQIHSAMKSAVKKGVLRQQQQRIKSKHPGGKEPIDVPPGQGFTSVSQLMRNIGQRLTPEEATALASTFVELRELEAQSHVPKLNRMLRMAGQMEASSDEEFRSQLPALLQELGLEIPGGLLKPPAGRAGRPYSERTSNIRKEWIRRDKPKITARVCDQLAKQFFAAELKGVDRGSPEHKKARERVRQALKRFEPPAAT